MPIFLCTQLCKGCCKDARPYARNIFITTENFSQQSRNKMNNLKWLETKTHLLTDHNVTNWHQKMIYLISFREPFSRSELFLRPVRKISTVCKLNPARWGRPKRIYFGSDGRSEKTGTWSYTAFYYKGKHWNHATAGNVCLKAAVSNAKFFQTHFSRVNSSVNIKNWAT